MVSLQGYHEPNDLQYQYTPQPVRKNITKLNTNSNGFNIQIYDDGSVDQQYIIK